MAYVADGRHKTHNREVDCFLNQDTGEYDVRVADKNGIYKSVLKTTDEKAAQDKFYSLVDMPGYSKGSWHGVRPVSCFYYGCDEPADPSSGVCQEHGAA
jgi:hypothetical protein